MLGNLVADALQHTPDTADITVRGGTDANIAVLEVCDEGPGMSSQDAQRVFERFTALTFAGAGQRWHRAGVVQSTRWSTRTGER